MRTEALTFLGSLLTLATSAPAQTPAVFSPVPVGVHACVAVPVELATGQALAGLRWLHNDGTQNFPRVLLLEGLAGQAPDLGQTGLVLYDAQAGDLQWGQLDLPVPVRSSTDFVYAVFVYPSNTETTGLGSGGGPGIGLLREPSEHAFYLSAEGLEWAPFSRSRRLAVDPVVVDGAAKGQADALVLSSLKDSVGYDPRSPGQASTPVRIKRTELHGARPNPFNPQTELRYDLARSGPVRLSVYNLRGQLVRVLVDGERPAGRYTLTWTGVDQRGRSVASGVYVARLRADGQELTERMVLVR